MLATAEYFSALDEMRSLLDTQDIVVQKLDGFLKQEEAKLSYVKHFLDKLEGRFGGPQGPSIDALGSIRADSTSLIGNPVDAFLLIKYLSKDWKDVTGKMIEASGTEVIQKILNETTNVPGSEDYTGAVSAILRLQETYKLDAGTIANGLLGGLQSVAPMTAVDCFNFGRTAYLDRDWVMTVTWMREALSREKAKEQPSKDFLSDILDHLSYSTSKTGNFKGALSWAEELDRMNPHHERVAGYLTYFKHQIQEAVHSRGQRGDVGDENVAVIPNAASLFDREYWFERRKYQALCRGDEAALKLSAKRAKQLNCRYVHRNRPRLILSPVKVEEVFDKPRLLVLHDLISDAEIDDVINNVGGRLRRATARNARTGQFEPADYRISKSAWLPPSTSVAVRDIFQRVEDLTNLDMEFSEDFQVNNYGIGGMYDPHFDFSRAHESTTWKDAYGDNRGNRIATVLFYLSDVEAGGATVFPTVGAAVQPKKGSAVFWYNLLPSGEGDLLTRHAGCPVLVGSKWVANFWIHEGGQEFRRRCRRSPKARR